MTADASQSPRSQFANLLWATTSPRGGVVEVWREPTGARRLVVANDRGSAEVSVVLTHEALAGLVRALEG